MNYYRLTITLKNGFKYSYTCIGKMLEGMKKSSEGYWTEKIEVVEITEEDHRKTREVTFTEDKVLRNAIVKSSKVVSEGKLLEPVKAPTKRKPKMASLEDFFDEPISSPPLETNLSKRRKNSNSPSTSPKPKKNKI